MANLEQTTASIWQTMQKAEPAAATLRKSLTLDDAYQVQLSLLARWQAAGKSLPAGKSACLARRRASGWVCRSHSPGTCSTSGHFESGHSFDYESIPRPILESELCFTIGKRIGGPGVTREQVLGAIGAIAPAFEIAFTGTIMADMPLGIADSAGQLAFVTGKALTPVPARTGPRRRHRRIAQERRGRRSRSQSRGQ